MSAPGIRRAPWTLLALCLLVVAVRAPLAVTRPLRNVDEYQYAAAGSFARLPGEGFFTLPQKSLRLHLLFHALSGGSLFGVDLLTSLVVGATSLLLGLAVWRRWGRAPAALLAAACYPLGILRFEGQSSNAEPFVNLFQAAWLLHLLSHPRADRRAQLQRGVLLGLAALAKEQALPLLALEPLRLLLPALDRSRPQGFPWRDWARQSAWAALGWALPILALLLGFALAGRLGTFLGDVLHWGSRLGEPTAGAPRRPPLLGSLLRGYRRLLLGPVGVLGLLGLTAELARPRRLAANRPARAGVVVLALLSLGLVALGLRFHGHYYQLAFPALAVLAGRAGAAALEGIRARRVWAGALALALVGFAGNEAARLRAHPALAMGQELHTPASYAAVQAAASAIARVVPPGEPIYVWGWRPDLYVRAGRPAASGYVLFTPGFLRPERLLRDLSRHPPGAVVVTPSARSPDSDSALERWPRVLAWLREQGYQPTQEVAGYELWTR